MAIPVYLQQFKAAGIYRLVFDKSTVLNVNSEILRLVVGYSEKGPFNIPTYVKNASEFKTLYGEASKKLEKRGIWFHRLAQQALTSGPILALNLKKFDNETVSAATIDTEFNPKFNAIDEEKLFVSDIYDTSRFWELDALKLNGLTTADGSKLDKYINICATDTVQGSATYFIRKAVGTTVSNYNITLNDWYSDESEPMPEYLEGHESTLVADYMAEIFVFKGKFTKEQVLASSSLKNHFEMQGDNLVLRKYELDAFGEPIDPLEALYNDSTSNALGHYVGTLIPYMKNKKGQYISLDILFNDDRDIHKMMMSFNTDLLDDENPVNINLSGKTNITKSLLDNICDGEGDNKAKVSVLGNVGAEIVSDTINYSNNVTEDLASSYPFITKDNTVSGIFGYTKFEDKNQIIELEEIRPIEYTKTGDAGSSDAGSSDAGSSDAGSSDAGSNDSNGFNKQNSIRIYIKNVEEYNDVKKIIENSVIKCEEFIPNNPSSFVGKKIISSIKRIKQDINATSWDYTTTDGVMIKLSLTSIETVMVSTPTNGHGDCTHVYNSSVTFIKVTNNWRIERDNKYESVSPSDSPIALVCTNNDNSLTSLLSVGDSVLSYEYKETFVTSIDTVDGITTITFTDPILIHGGSEDDKSHTDRKVAYIVRLEGDICQENGTLKPQFLEGYTYQNSKPEGSDMRSKLDWQNYILSALTDYKGIRVGLLNKSDIDYRYIVDTFETYVTTGAKKVLSYLAKEKQSAFAILNFPAVQTFMKCPYASFVNNSGIFDVQYVVDGYNKKKSHSLGFGLPSDDEGASFCAFYTPLKFSDGYIDNVVPSAALVSNLFMQKYLSRQPYYIIAGPNYGAISASGLVGPDYNYSKDELQIIEPYGVNCMVYRPNFGTFINANQTAKQTPVSALSRVNVRELVIYLQDEIEKVLQAYQWEFNNQTTRNAILERANYICANIQNNGGIQAYKNVMDESNNTPDIIDNEMAVLSTHIEPGMGAGKMIQELTIYRTGGLSASISD